MNIHKIKKANGTMIVPGDKSISHRSVMLASLANGISRIEGFLYGADCLSTIDCFRNMGINITTAESEVIVYGKGLNGLSQPPKMLYTGNSGTTTRLLCGILSGQKFDSSITGDDSICKRPMNRVVAPLKMMGADIRGEYCPLFIKGQYLKGIDYHMPVASAQVKTAILLAGLYAEGKTMIYENKKSRDHTELMLKAMGADISISNNHILLNPGSPLLPQQFTVPSDISSAAFFIVLALILPNSQLTIKNVGINPTRTGIIDVLKKMNADIKIENIHFEAGEKSADITVKSSNLTATEVSGDIIPRLIDEIPIIAVASLFANGTTVIKDAEELKVKETNRIRAIVDEFKKCGADIIETNDGMIIHGGKQLHSADFHSYSDHRMAMSLTVLAQCLDGYSTIDDCKCVEISYPQFFEDLYKLDI